MCRNTVKKTSTSVLLKFFVELATVEKIKLEFPKGC